MFKTCIFVLHLKMDATQKYIDDLMVHFNIMNNNFVLYILKCLHVAHDFLISDILSFFIILESLVFPLYSGFFNVISGFSSPNLF